MSSSQHNGGVVTTVDPVRPRLDRRSYLRETLHNKLQVQWIQSPGTEKSVVVMNVTSGSFNDGEVPGIGRALMNLLLMGSRKVGSTIIRDELYRKTNRL